MKKYLPLFFITSLILGSCSQPVDSGVGPQAASETLSLVSSGMEKAYTSSPAPSTDGEKTTGSISDPSTGIFTYSITQVSPGQYSCDFVFTSFVYQPGKTMTGGFHYDIQTSSTSETFSMIAQMSGALTLTGDRVANLVFNTQSSFTTWPATGAMTMTMTGTITADGHSYNINQTVTN